MSTRKSARSFVFLTINKHVPWHLLFIFFSFLFWEIKYRFIFWWRKSKIILLTSCQYGVKNIYHRRVFPPPFPINTSTSYTVLFLSVVFWFHLNSQNTILIVLKLFKSTEYREESHNRYWKRKANNPIQSSPTIFHPRLPVKEKSLQLFIKGGVPWCLRWVNLLCKSLTEKCENFEMLSKKKRSSRTSDFGQ